MSIRVSISLAQDQTRHFVWPDLGPNSLQKLSANDTSRRRGNQRAYNSSLYIFNSFGKLNYTSLFLWLCGWSFRSFVFISHAFTPVFEL